MSSADYPFKLGVTGSEFPLSSFPYWSRVSLSEIKFDQHKNYSIVAFKPGLPLQASELNEMQETWLMNNTLTCIMNASWPIYLAAYAEGPAIYGPGWKGTTPLYPVFDNRETTTNMVGISGGVFYARKGWYLVTVPSSGLQHWVYLNTGLTANVPADSQYIGFSASYVTVKPTNDPSLYDNSSGTQIPITGAPAGADRIQVKIDSSLVTTTNKNQANFSPIANKINSDSIRYMNNVPVPIEG